MLLDFSKLATLDNKLHKAQRDALSTVADLASIEFAKYPDLVLRCANGVSYHASMNEHNRRKFDEMETFPTLAIENYNSSHGSLESDGIIVVVHLERQ